MNSLTLGAARSALDQIVIDNPRAREAHARFQFLVDHGVHQGAGPKRCCLVVGPSQSGKTTILSSFEAAMNTPELIGRGEIPVLLVSLRMNITTKGLAQNILERIGGFGFQTGAFNGSENVLLSRVDKLLSKARVRLLIIDEFHHVVNAENRRTAAAVGETIKLFLISGSCPVVLSGVDEAKTPFIVNKQLSQRAEPMIELHQLDLTDPADKSLYLEFTAAYLKQCARVTDLKNLPGLLDGPTLTRIHRTTNGVLGATCNFLKATACLALEAGRDHVVADDLWRAADRCFVRIGLVDENPFGLSAGALAA